MPKTQPVVDARIGRFWRAPAGFWRARELHCSRMYAFEGNEFSFPFKESEREWFAAGNAKIPQMSIELTDPFFINNVTMPALNQVIQGAMAGSRLKLRLGGLLGS